MTRRSPSAPLRALIARGLVSNMDVVLDWGCGKGSDVAHLHTLGVAAWGWDPYHRPSPVPRMGWDIVLCTYVLNTLPPIEQAEVLEAITALSPGLLLVTVRRDIPRCGTSTQWWVELPAPWRSVVSNRRWETYAL
jgi:hypothetical protein